jgi:hypothetical protein
MSPSRFASQPPSTASATRSRTLGRLYPCDSLLDQLAHDLDDVPPELRQLIEQEHAMVGERHLTRHWHKAYIRDGVMGGATRARRPQPCAVAREAGDAVVIRAGLA